MLPKKGRKLPAWEGALASRQAYPARARDIAAHWKVSIKSARRDLAGLCACDLLRFVGARKNGRYQLVGP